MEQLRKAMLEAQKQRTTQADISEQAGRTDLPNRVNVLRDSLEKTPSEVDIDYTQTRIEMLDSKRLEANRILHEGSPKEVIQAFKILRTQVLQKLKLNSWNSLAVVSPTQGNGKTLTAINLAISLAQEVKSSVLLVDFDFIKPGIASQLGLEIDKGVTDFLLREEPVRDILINPGIERLVLLCGNESLVHSSEALGSPKMISLVEELKQRYPNRVIIFDLPPMLESDDAIAFSPYVDAMLLVIEEAKTTPDELERCAEILGDKPLLGSILNKAGS
jgi:protein-tyrosine kinase